MELLETDTNTHIDEPNETDERELLKDDEDTATTNSTEQCQQNKPEDHENQTTVHMDTNEAEDNTPTHYNEYDSDSDTGLANLMQLTPPRRFRKTDTPSTTPTTNADEMTDNSLNNDDVNINNTQLRGHVIDNIPINLHASFKF